jgi:hypothetical protein
MTTIEKIKVMQAYVDGKNIEFRNILLPNGELGDYKWLPYNILNGEPNWNWTLYEYRVIIPTCEGKIIEVDGKKYKLTSV